jgi:hypothetical protein
VLRVLRVVIAVVALLLLIGGASLLVSGLPEGISGLWLIGLGAAGIIAVALERMRYGSEAEEISGGGSGTGLDVGPADPRFQPTDERFVDPTTRRRVRVWVDPATGERRYRSDE